MSPVLYFPQTWSGFVNGFIYQFAGFILQTSQARNVTIDGADKYIVPSGDFTISESLLRGIGALPPPNLTSYTPLAIGGADNFNDGDVTIKDVFDIIVKTTREVTPTCKSPAVSVHIYSFTDPSRIKSEPSGVLGTYKKRHFLAYVLTIVSPVMTRMDGPSVLLNNFPHTPLGNSSTQFSSLETPCVHLGPNNF